MTLRWGNVVTGRHAGQPGPNWATLFIRGLAVGLRAVPEVREINPCIIFRVSHPIPHEIFVMTPKALADDKVWFTRKAWINAEERLLRNEHHTQLLMVVYAAYTTCVSVVLLKFSPTDAKKNLIDTGMAVLSIILLALSLYLNSKAFKDRAARFKQGYHELQAIEHELSTLGSSAATNVAGPACTVLATKYAKVLRDVENHNELDDIRARITRGANSTSRPVSGMEQIQYYWWRVWRYCTLALLYTVPAAVALWVYLN